MTSSETTSKAYSYVRFSTPEQAKGDSLRRQTALADEYAKRHGLTLDTELSMRDLGVSAFRGDNFAVGALGAFLKAIEDGLVPKGSLLLVEALDRISRKQARKAVRILEEILEGGVDVVTLNDGKRWTEESLDGADFLLAILLFMRGHEESATKAKRLKEAWSSKRVRSAKGELHTRCVPSWIRYDQVSEKLVLVPDRAALVRRMFKLFIAGTGKAGIAQLLNTEKIPTWGCPTGRAAAQYWHKTYIFKILKNRAVTGVFTPCMLEYRDGRKVRVPQDPIPDYYPRVVDDETFERTQTLIAARTATVRATKVASVVAGLARCPRCNATMTRVNKNSPKQPDKGGAPKLVCTKAKTGAGCDYHGVNLAEVELALIRGAAQLGQPPAPSVDLSEGIQGVSNELIDVELQIETLVDAIEKAPSAALSKRLAAREAEAERLRATLKELQQQAADSESSVVKHRAKRLHDCLTRLQKHPTEIAAANAALRECIDSVVVSYPTGQLLLNWRHGVQSSLLYGAENFSTRARVARKSD